MPAKSFEDAHIRMKLVYVNIFLCKLFTEIKIKVDCLGVVVFKRVERNHAIGTASVFCQCSRGQFELVKQKKERALVM